VLVQEPHIFDAEDEDFDALSTVHVICAEEEGHELRSSTRDVSDASESDARSSGNCFVAPLWTQFLTPAGVKKTGLSMAGGCSWFFQGADADA